MKKNKAMRLASILLVVTLLTTCAISGTFAKYTTAESATDTARVAKFGVQVVAEGKLFADTYKTTSNVPGAKNDATANATLSVVSSAITGTSTDHDGIDGTDKVVAPGTKSTDDGLQISVTGTPEVAVKLGVVLKDKDGNVISTKAEGDAKDVFLRKVEGTVAYKDMTTGTANDFFAPAADYHPVKYSLTGGSAITAVTDGTLGDVIAELAKLNDKKYDANTNLATKIGTLKLTWKWDYEGTGDAAAKKLVDQQDTLLGDLAADKRITAKTSDNAADPIVWAALDENTDFYLGTGLTIELSITQID